MSYPSSNRWVAKECLMVCGLAGLDIPAHIGFLGPWAVVPGADRLADLIEQLGLGSMWRDFHSQPFPLGGAILQVVLSYLDLGRSLVIQRLDS